MTDGAVRLTAWNPAIEQWDTYNMPITSVFGVQCSTPVMYTPKGIFGTRVNKYSVDSLKRMDNLKKAYEQRVFGLFDRVNYDFIMDHKQNVITALQAANMDNAAIDTYMGLKKYSVFNPIDSLGVCPQGPNPCTTIGCPVQTSTLN